MNTETNVGGARETRLDGPRPASLSPRDKRALLYALSLALDCFGLVAGYLAALQARESQWLEAGGPSVLMLTIPIFVMFSIAREAQSVDALESRTVAVRRALWALGSAALAVLAFSFIAKEQGLSRMGFLVIFGVAALVIVVNKALLDQLVRRWMDGAATATIVLLDDFDLPTSQGSAVVDLRLLGLRPDLARPETIDALSRIIAPYDRVVVACRFEARALWATFLKGHDIGGEIVLDRDLLHGAVSIGQFGGRDTLVLSRGPLGLASRVQKRAFDLVFSLAAIAFFLPLFLAVALLIKLESPGPVLFRQTRVGYGNRQFSIFKFRSMRVEHEDARGARSASRDDERITRVGRFIRHTSIDELPQLLNVLKGEMSIVGPRPHALGSLAGEALFWEASRHYWVRHACKPGITGLAQIRGLRGATETAEDLRQRVRADLEYISCWSLANDILIILRTLRVLVHKNAF